MDVEIPNEGRIEQYLTFQLAGDTYGVDILKVREIKGWEPVRQLPNSPPYIKGVFDLRGVIVPIIDLRERFALESVEYTSVTVVIIVSVCVQEGSRIMGIIADSVSDVLDVNPDMARAAPDLGASIDNRYIKGMAMAGSMVMLLDVDKLLDVEELVMTDSVT